MFVINHRNYVGEFKYQEDLQEYQAIWQDKNTGEYIECFGSNRFSCLINWIKTVNHHLKEKNKMYACD